MKIKIKISKLQIVGMVVLVGGIMGLLVVAGYNSGGPPERIGHTFVDELGGDTIVGGQVPVCDSDTEALTYTEGDNGNKDFICIDKNYNRILDQGINRQFNDIDWTVDANTCPNGIRVDIIVDATRMNSIQGGYMGLWEIKEKKDGGSFKSGAKRRIRFGAVKGGDSGYGWYYRATMSKTYYVTKSDVDVTFRPRDSFSSNVIVVHDSRWHVTCI
jgi:hypothetical protein